MDFKFRSDEDKTSSMFLSSSSSDNYFTEQALRAGFISSDIRRTDFLMSSDPLRDAIQRQLEKERIREEILAAEIIRKRELEAEVRRELAMERDLALRRGEGFSLVVTSSSPSMWSEPRAPTLHRLDGFSIEDSRLPVSSREEDGVSERLPFQRHPEMAKVAEVSKGKVGQVMFLAKPTSPNVTGTKRKIEAISGASELVLAGSKKKPQNEWCCALCKVSVTSEQGLNEHFRGKKHKSKEGELRANRTAGKQSGSSNSLPKNDKPIKLVKIGGSPNPKQGKKQEASPVQVKKNHKKEDMKKKFKFWCEHCNIGCHSEIVMGNHRGGKKHRTQLQAVKQIGGVVSAATTTTTTTDASASHGKVIYKTQEANEEVMENIDGEVDGVEVEEAEEEDGEEETTKTMESSSQDKVADAEALEELENDIGNSGRNNTSADR